MKEKVERFYHIQEQRLWRELAIAYTRNPSPFKDSLEDFCDKTVLAYRARQPLSEDNKEVIKKVDYVSRNDY